MDTSTSNRKDDLGAPLLLSSSPTPQRSTTPTLIPPTPSTPTGGYVPSSVRRRRIWFDNVFGVIFGIFAFIITLIALTMGVKAVVNRRTPAVVMLDEGTETLDPTKGTRYVTYEGFKVFSGLMLVCTLGVVLSALWMQVMVTCAPGLIAYTLMAVCLLGLGSAAAFFAGANPWAGVITLLVTCTALIYFQQLRKRMAFATANLKVACRALWESTPLLGVGFGLLLLQVGWGLLWALALIGAATNADITTLRNPTSGEVFSMSQCTTYETPGPNVNFTATCVNVGQVCMKCVCNSPVGGGVNGTDPSMVTLWEGRNCFSYKLYAGWLVVLLLGFLWGCAVLRNVGHCTVSGTVGTWWVSGGERAASTVGGHFKRAITTSFGSIALGSLLVAIVQTARSCLLAAHRANQRTAQSNTVTAMLGCLLGMVDRALSWFNKYALVYVALYGLDFMSAGAATTELFKARGISALVNDTLIEGVLTLGSIIVGLLCALTGYLYSHSFTLSPTNTTILSTSSFFLGIALALVVASLVESSVCVCFVLFAEDPQSLEISHAELSDELVAAWEDVLQGPLSGMGGMGMGGVGSYTHTHTQGKAGGFVPPPPVPGPGGLSPFGGGGGGGDEESGGKVGYTSLATKEKEERPAQTHTHTDKVKPPTTAVERAVANFGGGSSLFGSALGGGGGGKKAALDVSSDEEEEEGEEGGEGEGETDSV